MKIQIIVKPNAKKNSVKPLPDGTYRVCVKAPPVEGKANAAVVAVLAEFFRVPKSQVEILRGANAKKKLVKINSLP